MATATQATPFNDLDVAQQADDDVDTNIVPDVLLSLAKDSRYLEQCQSLLLEILPLGLDIHGASFVASLFYTILVLLRQGKTLGEEALGIGYNDDSNNRRRRLVIGSLLASTGMYMMRRLSSDASNDASANEASSNSNEMLRGRQRQRVYQEQRRRMLAQMPSDNEVTDSVDTASRSCARPAESGEADQSTRSFALRHAQAILRQVAGSLVPGFGITVTDGPHSSADTTTTTTTAASSSSLGAWIMRLHLAWYCLDDKYPTWMHRLLRLSPRLQQPNSVLSHRPNTARMVGMLIIMQAIGTLIPTVGGRLVQWLFNFLPRQQTPLQSPIVFYSETPQTAQASSATRRRSCVICQRDRLHPACSIKCGHVMCWKCLQQWIQEHHACPICRAPCHPQDVLALQAYSGRDNDDGADGDESS